MYKKYIVAIALITAVVLPQSLNAAEVVENIPVGTRPADVVVYHNGEVEKVYVANMITGTVSVIDAETKGVIKTIKLTSTGHPGWMVLSPDGSKLYVAERMSAKVKVISTETDTVIGSINTFSRLLNRISVSPDGTRLYVASAEVRGQIRLTIIDTALGIPVGYIETTDAQDQMIISQDGKIGYLQQVFINSNPLTIYTSVYNLETKTRIGSIQGTSVVVISADDKNLAWGRNYITNTVSKISLESNSIIKTKQLNHRVGDLIFAKVAGQDLLYVVNSDAGRITVLDAHTLDEIEVIYTTSINPNALNADSAREYLYVTLWDAGSVDVIKLRANNTAPEFVEMQPQQVTEGSALNFTVMASDVDGDNIVLSASGVPSGANFDVETGVFSWAPSLQDAGEYEVVFTATDSGNPQMSDEMRVPISVADVSSVEDLAALFTSRLYLLTLPTSIEKGYVLHLTIGKKLYEKSNLEAYKSQLEVLQKKILADLDKGVIPAYTNISTITEVLDEMLRIVTLEIEGSKKDVVPLITQTISPYPSVEETSSWANAVFAGGRADAPGDCGLTIRECGCAISSVAMLGKYYGVHTGADGLEVNPLNFNNWLMNVDGGKGYDSVGNLMWTWALSYLGKYENGKYVTNFRMNNASTSNAAEIKKFVETKGPALAFSQYPFHWIVLKNTLPVGYEINDPFWFNTRTTDDEKNSAMAIRDYNNQIRKATLIEHQSPQPVQKIVELSLNSPAQLLIVDEKGNRLGYDVSTGMNLSEIRGGSYDSEIAISNQSDPSSATHFSKHLMIFDAESDIFELSVIGTGEGEYSLTSAISDGQGAVLGDTRQEETFVGKVDSYTLVTNPDSDALPAYLKDILALVPVSEQKKFIQAFKVVFEQTQKEHVAVTETLVRNLISYVEGKYKSEAWAEGVIGALEAIVG